MRIGIPREKKEHEYRVGATPAMVRQFIEAGHEVVVESQAGHKIGFSDALFQAEGAKIVDRVERVYACDMIVKVKELQESECAMMGEGQILFCFLHLAPDPMQTAHLVEKKVVAIAYETVVDRHQRLPLLLPMSEIAGRISIQVGAVCLQLNQGGRGVLLGGVAGVSSGKVVILGGGGAGTEAARMALGIGADVTLLDIRLDRLRELDLLFGPHLKTRYSTAVAIEEEVVKADLVIGAVLIPGKLTPKLVTREMVRQMMPGSVIVDVSIDQGGCFGTSRPTTHSSPTFFEEDVLHYCVTNMPGACARTATLALTNATSRYALSIANLGWRQALREDKGLCQGLNVCLGKVTNQHVADDLGYKFVAPEDIL